MLDIKLSTDGTYFRQPITLACDLNCEKAWGGNNRPQVMLSMNEDDYAYLADNELGVAPIDPGTYEGDEAKPRRPVAEHNKWCARECERCRIVDRGKPITLRDFSKREYNMPSSEGVERLDFTVYWTTPTEEGEFYVAAPSRETACEIARWYADLYTHTENAELKIADGIVFPARGDAKDYSEDIDDAT